MSSLKSRLLTAAIGVPLVILLFILTEHFSFAMYIILSLLSLLLVYEILSAKKIVKNYYISIPCFIFALVEPFLVNTEFRYIPIFFLILLLFVLMIFKSDYVFFNDIVYSLFTTFVLVFGVSSFLTFYISLGKHPSYALVLPVGIAWLSDAGAYFVGVTLGKHKLCPKVSPNKTVEGFVGGLVIGTFMGVLISFICSLIFNDLTFNYYLLLIVGFVGSFISVVGDLTFSQIKRECNIKDYGSIFPGHGGMLDRFDSIIFVAPFVCMFNEIFPFMIG